MAISLGVCPIFRHPHLFKTWKGRRCDRDPLGQGRSQRRLSSPPLRSAEFAVDSVWLVASVNECQTWTVRFLLVRKVIPMRSFKTLEHRCRVRLVWTIPNSQTEIYVQNRKQRNFKWVACREDAKKSGPSFGVSVFPGKPAVLQWLPPSCNRRVNSTASSLESWIYPRSQTSKNIINKVIPIANAIPGVSFHVFHGFLWISMEFRWYPPVN